ncbi:MULTISPECIES: hypothetical protein [Leptospira]|uniref:Uncharacterized protein n=2 Tax=Leptospira TaxID=171 RepID=A0AAW5VGP9_9LEPT|nr:MULTISPECIES: hypothetical protein [Leptospira]MCW7470782.1 hypothetical protein [Leptospira kanakyensis]MCW7492466.1 hypothetical protein [Leptospira soteropolitanensis]MCW7500517.1 hypothetical protein [Leptospira soteropolitanensis]MCW7522813.1 hypothetical protein [Leptospira soteropolitanensis]MCW7526672.1 hypothetical protein [Leptospira soteropolitanensis]
MKPIQEKGSMFKEGEYLFATEEGVTIEELRTLFGEFGITKLEPLIIRDRSYLLVLKNDPGLPTMEKKASGFGKIRYIERNQIMQKYNTKL